MDEFKDFEEDTLNERMKEFVALVQHIPSEDLDKFSVSTRDTVATNLRPDNPNKMTYLLQWFEDLKQKVYIAGSLNNDDENLRTRSMEKNILCILHQCVLTHRWVKAAQLLEPLCEENMKYLTSVWKLSLEIMMKDQKKYEQNLDKIARRLISSNYNERHEVYLDYLLFLLSQKQYEKIDDLPEIFLGRLGIPNERNKEIRTLYSAYMGLVWYSEWLQLKIELEGDKNNTDILSTTFSQSQWKSGVQPKMENLADRMARCWTGLAKTSGVWDIFLYKLIEVYEEHDKVDEAKTLLLDYQKTNDSNISIANQIYYLYSRHQFPISTVITSLKQIIRLDPSSEKVFQLYQLLQDSDQPEYDYVSSMLFNQMDYSIYQQSIQGWTTLTSHIIQVFKSKLEKNIKYIKKIWKEREDVWLGYHFNINSVDPRWTPANVLYQKSLCCSIFNTIEDPFVLAAKDHLKHEDWKLIETTLQQLNRDPDS